MSAPVEVVVPFFSNGIGYVLSFIVTSVLALGTVAAFVAIAFQALDKLAAVKHSTEIAEIMEKIIEETEEDPIYWFKIRVDDLAASVYVPKDFYDQMQEGSKITVDIYYGFISGKLLARNPRSK